MNTIKKAKAIRLAIFDVDGILTSGKLTYGINETVLLDFHVRDGLGMQLLQKSGVQIAIITSRLSNAVKQRMSNLGIQHVFQGQREKKTAFKLLQQELKLEEQQIACMGDDLPDLPILKLAGFAATVPDAPKIIQEHVDWIASVPGGMGAVREFCEFIMQAQETFSVVTENFLRD